MDTLTDKWLIKTTSTEQFIRVTNYLAKVTGKDADHGNFYAGSNYFPFIAKESPDYWTFNGTYMNRRWDRLKRITWEDFLELESSLPKKWCIKLTKENKGAVKEYFREHITKDNTERYGWLVDIYYISEPVPGDFTYYSNSKPSDYTEISIEKLTKMPEIQTILGYKAPFKINQSIPEGTIYIAHAGYYCPQGQQGNGSNWYLPKDIVETWEVVYEPKSVSISIGNPARIATVFKDKVVVKSREELNYKFSNEDITSIIKLFSSATIKSLGTQVKTIQIGCSEGTEISLRDIQKIQELQLDL